jgi:hypothetical protein
MAADVDGFCPGGMCGDACMAESPHMWQNGVAVGWHALCARLL